MTQMEQIKQHLEEGKSITPLEALRMFGCFRLSAIIFNLRYKPYEMDIKVKMIQQGKKHFAQYYLGEEQQQLFI